MPHPARKPYGRLRDRSLCGGVLPIVALLFLVALPSVTLRAETGAAASDAVDQEMVQGPPDGRTLVEKVHERLDSRLLSSAEWLDSFFYDPRYETEENRTQAVLRLDIFDEEDHSTDLRTNVQIKLRLPQLQNKAHIIIEGDPDREEEEGTTAITQSALDESQDRSVSAAIGYFFRSDERRNVNIRFGARYRGGEVVVFARPHYRVLHPVGIWNLRLTQEFPWWSDVKWESLTIVDLERPYKNTFFRASAIGHWYDDRHGYFYTLGLSLAQPLSPRRAMHYEWLNNFETRPSHHLTESVVAVRYRQRVWRDWLYYDIQPQARFPRDRDFDLVPGILFRIEVFFGRYG